MALMGSAKRMIQLGGRSVMCRPNASTANSCRWLSSNSSPADPKKKDWNLRKFWNYSVISLSVGMLFHQLNSELGQHKMEFEELEKLMNDNTKQMAKIQEKMAKILAVSIS